jgi:hypothetical protein
MNSSPCCSRRVRRLRLLLAALLALAAALSPLLARATEAEAGHDLVAGAPAPEPLDRTEVVAEALFLCDPLPPGGRDLSLSVSIAEGERDPAAAPALHAFPRLQLAMALGARVGFTADVGFGTGGDVFVEAPGASLKVLLREPGVGVTGLAASLDLFGSVRALGETEAGLGMGAVHALRGVTLRAAASFATRITAWTPRLHAGASAAVALGDRWRALAELVADVRAGEVALAAGPTVKVALGDRTALMAGALFPLGAGLPTVTVQLTQSL